MRDAWERIWSHETRRCERSRSWKRSRWRSNESIHFQTFDFRNESANKRRMSIKIRSIKYDYYWCKTRKASIDDDEYQIWFSRFLVHKTMFSAFEAQIDESRCLVWN
jgi:hypothetical protein